MTISRLNGSYILPERFRMPGRRICLPLPHSSFSLSSRSFAHFFSSPSLSFFFPILFITRINASRMYTRSEIYGTAMKRPLRVRMREFEERGSSNEIRSRKQSTRSSKSWNKQPSEIDFVASDDSPRGSTSPDQWKRRRREKKK